MTAKAKTGEVYKVGIAKRILVAALERLAGDDYELKAAFPYSELHTMVLLQRRS